MAYFLCLKFSRHRAHTQRCHQRPPLLKKPRTLISSYSSHENIRRINQRAFKQRSRNQGLALRTAPLSPNPESRKVRPGADTPAAPAPFSSGGYHPRHTHLPDRKPNQLLNQRRCKNRDFSNDMMFYNQLSFMLTPSSRYTTK